MAGNMRQTGKILVTHPRMPIAATNPGGFDIEDNTVGGDYRIVHFGQFERLLIGGDERCSQGRASLQLDVH